METLGFEGCGVSHWADRFRQLTERYESWVLNNANAVRHMETMLNLAPQVVPKQLGDPDTVGEVGYSLVGLLRLYHDFILSRVGPKDSAVVRSCSLPPNRSMQLPLSLLSQTQVLAELMARNHHGEVARWRLIVAIELTKFLCKLVLLLRNGKCMLLGGGKLKSIETQTAPRHSKPNGMSPQRAGARTGKRFGRPTTVEVSSSAENGIEADEQRVPLTAVTFEEATIPIEAEQPERVLAGEFLHIVRPLVYAVLRQRRGDSSWVPMTISLMIELSSLYLSISSIKEKDAGGNMKRAQEELSSRKLMLLLYLLRDPVYLRFTEPAAEKVCSAADNIPLLGQLLRFANSGFMSYYHHYHFYNSAS